MNYVYNKVICTKETMDRYFIDTDPFGDGTRLNETYITFNKLLDTVSITETEKLERGHISYAHGNICTRREDGLWEILFLTLRDYPIKAIVSTIQRTRDTIWYVYEENCIYMSKFYWEEGVKESVLYIEAEYDEWYEANIEFIDSLEAPDNGVWHFYPLAKEKWRRWEGSDLIPRYAKGYAGALDEYLKLENDIHHFGDPGDGSEECV